MLGVQCEQFVRWIRVKALDTTRPVTWGANHMKDDQGQATPVTPDGGTRDPNPITWRGAQVKNLIGLDERSATGLGTDVGVLVVTVPAGSQAETDGFKNYDVILQFGGQGVVSLDDLNRLYTATTAGQKVVLGIHRNQQDTTITITR
jgi:S1-C subfamily serine protease